MRVLLAFTACLCPALGAVQPEKDADAPAPTTTPQQQSIETLWGKRLTALSPQKPVDYFLLGEEVAADSKDAETAGLARRLFVLAYELDARETGSRERSRLGPSVCLALASVAARDDERRWLRALADTLSDGSASLADPANEAGGIFPPETAFDLATAIGLARAGEGRRAEQLLEKPGVSELLEQIDTAPMPDGSVNGLRSFFKKAIRDWPVCPQCRNRRVVPVGANRSGEVVLCDTCRGNPGPQLAEHEIAGQLRVEALLLQGTQRSWAAQVLADAGAPLRDLDPTELAGTYDVDPSRPLWRGGQWTAEPNRPAPAAETPKPE